MLGIMVVGVMILVMVRCGNVGVRYSHHTQVW